MIDYEEAIEIGTIPEGDEDDAFTFSVLWWLYAEPGMDDRLKEAGNSLDEMFEEFKIYPVIIHETDEKMLFLARFEAIIFEEEFKHSDILTADKNDRKAPKDTIMFVDFLTGMPYSTVEMIGIVGELSSDPKKVKPVYGEHEIVPAMPNKVFTEPFEKGRVLWNVLSLDTINKKDPYTKEKAEVSLVMAKNLEGEPLPKKCHWWHRLCIVDKDYKLKWPVPGEFLSLCPRLYPVLPWGEKQESNPFMFSGNWMETTHYTNVKITKVIAPDEDTPYPRYEVNYRKYENVGEVKPTDFAEYKVDDRVTILRVPEDKDSWTWDDLTEFDKEEWVIAPVSFYDDVANKED
jgi:hypothetical protein